MQGARPKVFSLRVVQQRFARQLRRPFLGRLLLHLRLDSSIRQRPWLQRRMAIPSRRRPYAPQPSIFNPNGEGDDTGSLAGTMAVRRRRSEALRDHPNDGKSLCRGTGASWCRRSEGVPGTLAARQHAARRRL